MISDRRQIRLILGKLKIYLNAEAIKLITENSELLFNGMIEHLYDVSAINNEDYIEYNLTIYLPLDDKDFTPYGNFEYLFVHDKYLSWKKNIIAEFLELSDQFLGAE
ncbi:MAG: hypothetical protein P4L79_03400 [Legionella sp.]|uniref:hypothetical protein n=1 Tax=Legionella sp. TaxID=459 RepID=UPI00283DB428|nr:hypothetical protein [Legionella sp.]